MSRPNLTIVAVVSSLLAATASADQTSAAPGTAFKCREKIARAECRTRGGSRNIVVKIKRATPERVYAATLDSGAALLRTAGLDGRATFKFGRASVPSCGPDAVTVACRRVSLECGCPNPKPADMVLIPAGEFAMGCHAQLEDHCRTDELPVHEVYLDAFRMDVYEVTNGEYAVFLNSVYGRGEVEVLGGGVYQAGGGVVYCDTTTSSPRSRITWDGITFGATPGREHHPVVQLSWFGAAAYANWLSAQDGRPPCYDTQTWECNFDAKGYRLPTEAEWEYAARGGGPYVAYPWGGEINGSNANYEDSGDPFERGEQPSTTPVGFYDGRQFPPGDDMANGYGLYDMNGGVLEWCNDRWDENYYRDSPRENPRGPDALALRRVIRGGAWNTSPYDCRTARRRDGAWGRRMWHIGFRIVRPE